MRLFIALPLPDEAKSALAEIQGGLRGSRAQMKIVEHENLHMTLRFIGPGEPAEWIAKLDKIVAKPFDLFFDRIGAFPDALRPRVVWAGCEPPESLLNIHRVIADEELAPHVTLARVRGKPDEALKALVGREIRVPAHIGCVQLLNSTLGPGGPIYEVLYEKAL